MVELHTLHRSRSDDTTTPSTKFFDSIILAFQSPSVQELKNFLLY